MLPFLLTLLVVFSVRAQDKLPVYPAGDLNYDIHKGNNMWGVLDQERMEWLIKPQPLEIVDMDYPGKDICDSDVIKRGDVEVYLRVMDGNEQYYIDKDLKAYRPK